MRVGRSAVLLARCAGRRFGPACAQGAWVHARAERAGRGMRRPRSTRQASPGHRRSPARAVCHPLQHGPKPAPRAAGARSYRCGLTQEETRCECRGPGGSGPSSQNYTATSARRPGDAHEASSQGAAHLDPDRCPVRSELRPGASLPRRRGARSWPPDGREATTSDRCWDRDVPRRRVPVAKADCRTRWATRACIGRRRVVRSRAGCPHPQGRRSHASRSLDPRP